jgi:hypothetical protein
VAAVAIPESLGDLRSLAFLYLDRARLAGMFLGWSDPTDHPGLTDFRSISCREHPCIFG